MKPKVNEEWKVRIWGVLEDVIVLKHSTSVLALRLLTSKVDIYCLTEEVEFLVERIYE